MAAEIQEEKLTEANQEVSAEEQPAEEERNEQQAEPKAPGKKRELLLPVLTLLLIVLGISEAAFWGFFGVSSYRHSLATRRYEEQQKLLEAERASRGVVGSSAYGPYRKMENGTVTWQREDDQSAGSGSSGEGSGLPRQDEKRMSRLSVPVIPYALAEMDTDDTTAQNQSAGTSDDSTVPIST